MRASAGWPYSVALGALGDAVFCLYANAALSALPVVVTALALAGFVTAAALIERARATGRGARPRASSLVVQGVTALVAVTALLRDPMMLLLLLPLIVAARAYYRARFGLSYPG